MPKISKCRFLKFKCEHHLGFIEVRKQFHESEYARDESYPHAVSASLSSPPPHVNYITKSDLNEMLQSFTENIAAMMHSVLDAQTVNCQNMLPRITSSVIGALRDLLVLENSSFAGSSGKSASVRTAFASFPVLC